MALYTQKPVNIEAEQFKDDAVSLVRMSDFTGEDIGVSYADPKNPVMYIGDQSRPVPLGFYVIKGNNGKFYGCSPKTFHDTFEPVE